MKFHEYWDNENKLLELSYKESIRQREERRCKTKTSVNATQKKKLNRGNVVNKKSLTL
jgi:hypothetical protein|tara:strand:+ start:3051 stop:3224 length:174 start_codon:yes stop_codon:yes gene_type:complete